MHIATIVLGLVIAVGLDKIVEAIHHHHQRVALERQLREVFEDDLASDRRSLAELHRGRDYLADLLTAIRARLAHEATPPPSPDEHRLGGYTISPNFAPYEVAKQNGQLAVLADERLRIFNRVNFALELLGNTRRELYSAMDRLGGFHARYVDSRGSIQMGEYVPGPDLDRLTVPELQEYAGIVALTAKLYDTTIERIRLFDFEAQEVLGGVPSEQRLIARLREVWGSQGREPQPLP